MSLNHWGVFGLTHGSEVSTCEACCTVEPDSQVQINNNAAIAFLSSYGSEENVIDTDIPV
jgi:hypothetical protein